MIQLRGHHFCTNVVTFELARRPVWRCKLVTMRRWYKRVYPFLVPYAYAPGGPGLQRDTAQVQNSGEGGVTPIAHHSCWNPEQLEELVVTTAKTVAKGLSRNVWCSHFSVPQSFGETGRPYNWPSLMLLIWASRRYFALPERPKTETYMRNSINLQQWMFMV